MAEQRRFACDHCDASVEAWSDGNPYYLDSSSGAKRYAYHPDHANLERCVGNDSPHLCLRCAHTFMVDSNEPLDRCPKCGEAAIADTFGLAGRECPYCKTGRFRLDPDFRAIS
jgi:hypothetical protein